jgi:hypothetical protein
LFWYEKGKKSNDFAGIKNNAGFTREFLKREGNSNSFLLHGYSFEITSSARVFSAAIAFSGAMAP